MQTDKTRYWLLAAPALAVMIVFYIWPLVNIWAISMTEPALGFGNYVKMTESQAVQTSFVITFRVAALTTVICVLLGYICAYSITNVIRSARPLLIAMVLLPFWVSVLIRSFAWIVLLGRSGLVNDAMRDIGLIDAPMRLMHNEFGVVLAMVHVMLPFAVLPMMANMRGIDRAYTEAARGLGASEFTAFRMVYLPQTLPGVASGALLVFVLSLGFYITPALLGGGRVLMVSEYITYQIQEFLNWGLGTAISVALLVATALVLIVAARFVNLRSALLERS
ncbi:putative spermidine/putrescine transport system permease protein/spermidine/putrescine transport system permease protein [Albimonas donghaensis]|uniref:Putative spermidine/putrescine transport system permease protein/spermidine/putrescine transport system permease protein n=1 Tax=Albimonas donghaensis TaxID=356660 RepID=A0A1H3ENF5_9RHOB|nr:ABC transporter permease [Albimonas donghaensis]SDX79678.1 putative spermidine/putrescine transport system permease protein/spermidine/putrescine transport system permease protein [Albimonas donghaensis]